MGNLCQFWRSFGVVFDARINERWGHLQVTMRPKSLRFENFEETFELSFIFMESSWEHIFPERPSNGNRKSCATRLVKQDPFCSRFQYSELHHWGAALGPWLNFGLRWRWVSPLTTKARERFQCKKMVLKRELCTAILIYQFANLESILKPALTLVVFSVETINEFWRFWFPGSLKRSKKVTMLQQQIQVVSCVSWLPFGFSNTNNRSIDSTRQLRWATLCLIAALASALNFNRGCGPSVNDGNAGMFGCNRSEQWSRINK